MTKEEQVVEVVEAKEEEKEIVEVKDQSLAIDVDNKDIMPEIVLSPQNVTNTLEGFLKEGAF